MCIHLLCNYFIQQTFEINMKNSFYFICFLFGITLIGCSDDNSVSPQPNPTNEIIKAEIVVKQAFSYMDNDSFTWLPNDTILFEHNVFLTATGSPTNRYEWLIMNNNQTLFGKERNYRHDSMGELKIRLIVRGDSTKLNYPGDDGIDTAFKTIYYCDASKMAVMGEYFGSDSTNPSEKYNVKLYYDYSKDCLVLENIDKGLTFPEPNASTPNLYDISYKVISFNAHKFATSGNNNPKGRAELQPDGKTIIINYESGSANNRTKHKFVGTKI